MKPYNYVFPLFIITLFLLGSCSSEKKAEIKMEEQPTEEKALDITADMLTTTHDPVCDMDLTQHAIGDTTIYENQLYGFCSEYCKNKFVENPRAYLTLKEK